MYATDFSYDGLCLSDFGMILCSFDGASENNISIGSKITFNKVSMRKGKKFNLTGIQYDECITATFQIMKNPCDYDFDIHIKNEEYRDLVRWLNRKEFLRFQMFNAGEPDADICFFNASFNIEKVLFGGQLCGLTLTMETDAPFGYGEEQNILIDIQDTENKYYVYDISDEIGYTYPLMQIVCHEDGDLKLLNETENITMIINNCSAGEIIKIDGESQIISSSYDKHHLYDDFNYEFFRIANSFEQRENIVSSTLPCTVTITYSPIIKDIPE